MNEFLIYGKENCVHCTRAKEFLDERNIPYVYLDIYSIPPEDAKAIVSFTGMKTVPIVFQGQMLIGGADDLIKYVKETMNEV